MISERNIRTVVTWVVAVIAGLASFYVTRGLESKRVTSGQQCMRNWLGFSGKQDEAILQSDPHFDTDAAGLSLAFVQSRQNLARLLDIPSSRDDEIMAQVEKVIGANHDLIKRVVEHILAVRSHLSPEQSQQLMRLCGDIIRGMGARGRLGGGGGGGYGQGRGSGRGPGAYGQGLGRGQGRRRRQHGQLTQSIALDPDQMQIAGELDSSFEAESAQLAATVEERHEQFALLLETSSAGDDAIWQGLERLLEARTELERRTVRYLLLIRPHLSPEQQKVLVGLCAQCGRFPEN
jgi:Spy/CpxP family protein refolding chaperone